MRSMNQRVPRTQRRSHEARIGIDRECARVDVRLVTAGQYGEPTFGINGIESPRSPPRLNIACCGVAPRSKKTDWLKLANGDATFWVASRASLSIFS